MSAHISPHPSPSCLGSDHTNHLFTPFRINPFLPLMPVPMPHPTSLSRGFSISIYSSYSYPIKCWWLINSILWSVSDDFLGLLFHMWAYLLKLNNIPPYPPPINTHICVYIKNNKGHVISGHDEDRTRDLNH